MMFTRKRNDGTNSRIANMVQQAHAVPAPVIIIEFEDRAQDFLTWVVDATTGEVVDCQPFQASVWCGKYVDKPQLLQAGDKVHISDTPIDPTNLEQEFSTIIYPLIKVIK